MKNNTKIVLLCVLSILIVIAMVVGITYSFMRTDVDESMVTEVTLTSCAKLTLNDSDISISLENTSPISKNRALQTTPYTFSVTSSCEGSINYNLYLATLNSNTLDASNIRYMITEHGNTNIITEGILSDASNALSEFSAEEQAQLNSGINGTFATIYKVYTNSLAGGDTNEYDLYLYVDETITATDTMNKTFTVGVAAKAS